MAHRGYQMVRSSRFAKRKGEEKKIRILQFLDLEKYGPSPRYSIIFARRFLVWVDVEDKD